MGKLAPVIYGLMDPRDEIVRYVGKSIDVVARLRGHIAHTLRDPNDSPKTIWIAGLLDSDVLPIFTVLNRECLPTWQAAERRWIEHFGIDALTNLTRGGEGWSATNRRSHVSEEGLRQMDVARRTRIYVTSDETKAKLSAVAKGRPMTWNTNNRGPRSQAGRDGIQAAWDDPVKREVRLAKLRATRAAKYRKE